MLARYLRRPSPIRYAAIPREAMPSVQFGLKSLARMRDLPSALRFLEERLQGRQPTALGPAPFGHSVGQLPRRDAEMAHSTLADLVQTGHPAALMALLDHLHDATGVQVDPRESHPGHTLPGVMQALNAMRAQVGVAAQEPLHPLRMYTPELLHGEDAANDYLSLDPTIMQDYPEVSNLHPYLGGPGLAGLHDAHDRARMEGRTLSNYRPTPAAYLGQLITSLHHGLTQRSGELMARRNQGGR